MRFFFYAIVFAVVFLVFKALFLDSYLQEKNNTESNNSTEAVQDGDAPQIRDNSLFNEKKEQAETDQEAMPLDKLGNSIADKIADKL
jgi:hypothetical protein